MAEGRNPEPLCNWNEVDIRFKSRLRPFLVRAAQYHDPTIITVDDEQMAQFANNFVFSSGWNSNVKPEEPVMAPMLPMVGAIKVGSFKQDLPTGFIKSSWWDKKHNPDAPIRRLRRLVSHLPILRSRHPQLPMSRRAGKPAYFRARMDKNSHSIIHDYVDFTGMLVPMSYIAFDNGGDTVSDIEVENAYRAADEGREKIITDWNRDLCVYIWRRAIRVCLRLLCHDRQGYEFEDYTADDFVTPPSIRKEVMDIFQQGVRVARSYNDEPHRAMGFPFQ